MMNVNSCLRLVVAAPLLLVAAACSSPSEPSSSAPPSVSAPTYVGPTDSSRFTNAQQPITLTVQNVSSAQGSGVTTYVFEVATDSAFANRVQIRENVAE